MNFISTKEVSLSETFASKLTQDVVEMKYTEYIEEQQQNKTLLRMYIIWVLELYRMLQKFGYKLCLLIENIKMHPLHQ